jgi:hypothetical protein
MEKRYKGIRYKGIWKLTTEEKEYFVKKRNLIDRKDANNFNPIPLYLYNLLLYT